MINSGDLKPGQTISVNGDIYVVLDISKNKTARSAMVVKTKVRNLRTGTNLELRFNDSDRVEPANIEKREMQYLYDDGESLVFMDNETYEQVEIPEERLDWEKKFLKENDNVNISVFQFIHSDGQRLFLVSLIGTAVGSHQLTGPLCGSQNDGIPARDYRLLAFFYIFVYQFHQFKI